MPLKYTFVCKTTLVEHERGRYACPLVFPEQTGETCPIDHKKWPKGCVTVLSIENKLHNELLCTTIRECKSVNGFRKLQQGQNALLQR